MRPFSRASLRDLLDMRLGGFGDCAALIAALGGGALNNPLLYDVPLIRLLSFAASTAGASWLTSRYARMAKRRTFNSPVHINSDPMVEPIDFSKDWGGMLIGYTVDGARPVVIPWSDWMQHGMIIGRSGMGKTVLLELLMFQQIGMGGGVFNIDAKIDSDNLLKITAMCEYWGRRHQLKLVNPGNPDLSNTYSPILHGDADEVASRIISLIPSAETSPGADFYRQGSLEATTIFVRSIKQTGLAYTFRDLSILLQNEKAMMYLMSMLPANSEAAGMFKIFLERFKTSDRQGNSRIDTNKILGMFGGVAGRLFSFGEGNFGKITETYSPEVSLYDDIMANSIIYTALPTMGKSESALNFAKMMIGDWRSALARIQSIPKSLRPSPPTLGAFDEAGGYINQPWGRILEQARSANQAVIPAFQTNANLEAQGKELAEMITGNMATMVAFALGTESTTEMVSEAMGHEMVSEISTGMASGGGESATAGTGMKQSASRNVGMNYSEKESEVLRVPADALKAIYKGEAIVSINKVKVAHVRIPRVEFSDAFMKYCDTPQVNRSKPKYVKGMNMFQKFGRPDDAQT
jgi:hypothetical protein